MRMQHTYLSRLPEWLQHLVEDTEAHMGFGISVQVEHAQAWRRPGEPDALACALNPTQACIFTPHETHFPNGSVLHELLHIRRCLVEGVPRLIDREDCAGWSPSLALELMQHDNQIEHLAIVPLEIRYMPSRRDYWQAKMRRVWPALALHAQRGSGQARVAMAHWVFMRLVLPESPSTLAAGLVLQMLGVEQAGEAFRKAVNAQLGHKEQLARIWFEHLGLPFEAAALEYNLPSLGSSRAIGLSEWSAAP